MSAGALRTAQELRAILEKWIAIAAAAATNQQQVQLDDSPPPRYTPRDVVETTSKALTSSSSATTSQVSDVNSEQVDVNVPHPIGPSEIRPVDHRRVQLTDREVNAYTYAPNTKQTQKLQKKREFETKLYCRD